MISSTGIVARGMKGSVEWRERKRINTEDSEVESTEGTKKKKTGLKPGHYVEYLDQMPPKSSVPRL